MTYTPTIDVETCAEIRTFVPTAVAKCEGMTAHGTDDLMPGSCSHRPRFPLRLHQIQGGALITALRQHRAREPVGEGSERVRLPVDVEVAGRSTRVGDQVEEGGRVFFRWSERVFERSRGDLLSRRSTQLSVWS